ncbi:MAG: hypothetical protein JW892_01790 [Anaerolineae bacterium]|nr:hypothetical protein [Anaerolineae bacterium]
MAELASRHITNAKRQVYSQFPELKDAEPEISARATAGKANSEIFILTFKGKLSLPDGHSLTRVVHATVNQDGDIVKITSSR